MENPKVVNLNEHREQKRLERKESVAAIKDEINGMALDYFATHSNTELLWEDLPNENPDVLACIFMEHHVSEQTDMVWTNVDKVSDFAFYVNAHKPAGLEDYRLAVNYLKENPPRMVFESQKSV